MIRLVCAYVRQDLVGQTVINVSIFRFEKSFSSGVCERPKKAIINLDGVEKHVVLK